MNFLASKFSIAALRALQHGDLIRQADVLEGIDRELGKEGKSV